MPECYRIDKIDTVTRDGKTQYDTAYHRVAELQGINQLGDTVALNKDLKGKLLVIDFFYTTCHSICPRLSSGMQLLLKSYIKKNPGWVQFVSITVDPARDSVAALRQYADRYTKEHDKWWFVTGNKDSIFNYAKNELGLVLDDADHPGDYIHTNKMVLIDADRHIRGYYDGLDTFALRRLADDVALVALQANMDK